jgi:hypothetical protein
VEMDDVGLFTVLECTVYIVFVTAIIMLWPLTYALMWSTDMVHSAKYMVG